MNSPEYVIRDALIHCLDLLEPGLTRLAVEERLPNIHGSSGFVDILARDRFGNLVVIEIKRDDSAAREALHELFKYTALLRQNYHVAPHQLRCMVVSTVWRELLVPFSDFARAVQFPVTGYRLLLDQDGELTGAEIVELLSEEPSLAFSPEHWIGCHQGPATRQRALRDIDTALVTADVTDYLVLFFDHDLSNPAICHPYLCYVVIARLPKQLATSLRERNVLHVGAYCEGGVDNPEWAVEEAIIAQLYSVADADSVEFGSPESFPNLMSDDWTITAIHRRGKLSNETVYPDDALLEMCCGPEDKNAVMHRAFLRPEFSLRWSKTVRALAYTLEGNRVWKTGILHYLTEVAHRYPKASVSIQVYNPMNLLPHLHKFVTTGNSEYLPSIQIVVEATEGIETRSLIGGLSWNGMQPSSPEEIVDGAFGSLMEFMLSQTLHTAWQYEEKLCQAYGLRYTLTEVIEHVEMTRQFQELMAETEQCSWSSVKDVDKTFDQFLSNSVEHFWAIEEFFASFSTL